MKGKWKPGSPSPVGSSNALFVLVHSFFSMNSGLGLPLSFFSFFIVP